MNIASTSPDAPDQGDHNALVDAPSVYADRDYANEAEYLESIAALYPAKQPRRLYVVTVRLRVMADDPLDALMQGYDFMDGDDLVKRDRKTIEEDLKDVRLATPQEQARRKKNLTH